MLEQHDRLSMISGFSNQPHEPVTWNFLDNDTRRWVSFEGPFDEYYDEEEGFERAYSAFLNNIEVLDINPQIRKVVFSSEGNLSSYSTAPEDDITPMIHYPLFVPHDLQVKQDQVIRRKQLTELDRLQPSLDIVNEQSSREKSVFKYDFTGLPDALKDLWNDAFIVQKLSGHPNIVPFRHFVLDDHLLGFLGFTMGYISGGSLEKVHSRPLTVVRRNWLTTLMHTIDDLNLKYGIMHQDIALRNILVDGEMNQLYLCDFGSVARIGSTDMATDPDKDDGKMLVFTIHHLLTGNQQYFQQHPSLIDISSIISMKEWPLSAYLKLEAGITVKQLRAEVIDWYEKRSKKYCLDHIQPRHQLQWPSMPKTSMYDNSRLTRSQARYAKDHDGMLPTATRRKTMRFQLRPSEYIVGWERISSNAQASAFDSHSS